MERPQNPATVARTEREGKERQSAKPCQENSLREAQVAEGGGLLNRCRVKSPTEGSNPSLSV